MVPRRSSRGGDAAATEALTKLLVRENPAHSFDDGVPLVRNDERLAVWKKPAMPERSETMTGVLAAAASAATIPKLSPGRGEDEDVGLRIQVVRWLLRDRHCVDPALGRRVPLRLADERRRAVTVVRPGDHEMRVAKLARCVEQVLDSLPAAILPT